MSEMSEEFDTDDAEFDSTEHDHTAFSLVDDGQDRTISSKEAVRRKLEEDVLRFLREGGQVNLVETNTRADPPRKPESNYGSRPI
ncbi:Hypothetical protein HDN1F_28040 [gamma proteobacterium HdN1]|nr:Hypothetical protein HDN1F_28040 [gamma proteobacterium HdN1]